MTRQIQKLTCLIFLFSQSALFAQHKFSINLNDIDDDQFKVTLEPDGLTAENDIFQFAATAPGTYQIMDIGRFVRSFVALDANGDTVETENIATNQWQLSKPEEVAIIHYSIAETWDTPVTSHKVYNMAGTSLEKDHAFINNQAVLGYFKGMQDDDIWVKLEYPEEWEVGSALTQNEEGYFVASDYDFAVDSPFLLGRLTVSSADIEGTTVDVFTYSKSDLVKSEEIFSALEDILYAASDFTEGLPVDRYVFLFHFEDADYGAWEHSYSSIYALGELPLNEPRIQQLRSIIAHEFFHVVTPLNIHSELVEEFNFVTPELSQHLWLYEGVTEWAAWKMQLQDSLMNLEQYLQNMTMKLKQNDGYDPGISLTELGVNATELSTQYGNIYHKGAMTASILDLILIEQSKGKKGLRVLINELAEKYGPDKPFNEETFFDELTKQTYPEVGEFIEKYIKGTEPLPIKEYFEKIGVDYEAFAGYDSSGVALGIGLTLKDNKIAVSHVENPSSGIKEGDFIHKMDSVEVNLANAQAEFGKLYQKKAGDTILFTLMRDGEEVDINYILPAKKISHVFTAMEEPTKKQMKLREGWIVN